MYRILVLMLLFFNALNVAGQNNLAYLQKAFANKDSADYFFGKAKKAIKNTADEAMYFFCKNAFCTDYGKEDSALYYGTIALQKYKQLNDTIKPLYIYNNMAKVYQKKAQYQKAITQLFAGLKCAQKQKNTKWQGWLLQNISLNYHDFGDYVKGVNYGKQAYEILRLDTADAMSIIYAINAIAINFDDWNKPDSALFYHQKSLGYQAKVPQSNIGFVYNNIGNSLVKLKKFAEAIPSINKAIGIAESNLKLAGNTINFYEMATSYTNLAKANFELKNYKLADLAFNKAKIYVQQSRSAEKERDYYQLGFLINKALGNYKAALSYSEKYNLYRDRVFKKDNAKAIAEIEAKYNVAEKEKMLLSEKIRSAKKNTLIFGLSAFVLGTIVIAYLLYKQQKVKNIQQQQEHKLHVALNEVETQNKLQHQRLSIARDLHDNIGAQLTFIISSVDTLNFRNSFGDDHVISKKLAQISSFAKDTITELRDTLWALNIDVFTVDDLRLRMLNFLEKVKLSSSEINLDFKIDDTLNELVIPSAMGINIYRAMQEAINNALKHAKCSLIKIEVLDLDNQINIKIEDNGLGFALGNHLSGNGLMNMKKRIEEASGYLYIQSNENVGTEVVFTLPK